MEMLIQTRTVTAHFINEYRLFGTVYHDHKIMLMLWDSSNPCNPEDLPGIIFEPGQNYVYSHVDLRTHSHETNHVLPFRESFHGDNRFCGLRTTSHRRDGGQKSTDNTTDNTGQDPYQFRSQDGGGRLRSVAGLGAFCDSD